MTSTEPGTPAGVARWRKRPVAVEAIQVIQANMDAAEKFTGATHLEWEFCDETMVLSGALLWVAASKAVCHLGKGDWIIREPDGSGFYPCRALDFVATYEPVSSAEPAVAQERSDEDGMVTVSREDLRAFLSLVRGTVNTGFLAGPVFARLSAAAGLGE